MPPDLLARDASPLVFLTLSHHRLGRYPSSKKTVEIPSAMNLRNHSLPLVSNSREIQRSPEIDSLFDILHLVLFYLTMKMVFGFLLPKCFKCFAFSPTTTMRANKLSRVARKQETLPDTSVEVNPVPPMGWRRMAEPPGNKGRALLEPDALEPSLSRHHSDLQQQQRSSSAARRNTAAAATSAAVAQQQRSAAQHCSCPVYAIQAGAEVEDPADASLLHCIFNHNSVDRITRTIEATKGLLRHYIQQPVCDSCVVTRAVRHTAKRNDKWATTNGLPPGPVGNRRPPSMAAHLFSLDPDDPILGEHQEDVMSEGDSDEEECTWEPEEDQPHPIQAIMEDPRDRYSSELEWEEADPDEDEDSLARQYVLNVMAYTPIYNPKTDATPLQGSTGEVCSPQVFTQSTLTSKSESSDTEDAWTEGEYDSDESEGPIYMASGDASETLAEGGDDLHAVGDTWCEIEYQAEEFGRVYSKGIPKHDISTLRPFEIVFCDNKDYDCPQRGGHTTALVFVCLKTLAKHKVDLVRKVDNGRAAQQYFVMNGMHKLPYKCTVYSDGCGSMAHVAAAAIRMGIDHLNIPPHDHALNLAEYAQKQMWEIGRTILHKSKAPESLMCYAVSYAMYVDLRMSPTSRVRSNATPYELIHGSPPNVAHLVPFFTKSYVTVPKPKRLMLKKRGISCRAESGRFLGFTHPYGKTSRVLLDEITTEIGSIKGDRLVDSISVIHSPLDHVLHKADRYYTERIVSDTSDGLVVLTAPPSGGGGLVSAQPQPPYSQEANKLYEEHQSHYDQVLPSRLVHPGKYPGVGPGPGPLIKGVDKKYVCEQECGYESDDVDKVLTHEQHCTHGQDERPGNLSVTPPSQPCPQDPTLTMEDLEEVTVDIEEGVTTPEPTARVMFLTEVEAAFRTSSPSGINTLGAQSKIDSALHKAQHKFLIATTTEKVDHGALQEASSMLAQGALKDIKWKKALESDLRDAAIKAYHTEMDSLQKTILKRIDPKLHPNMAQVMREATPCRVLLDVKRNGTVKARAVKQGFKEDKERADGADFNYYSHVAKMDTIRTVILRPNRRDRVLAVKDVRTAFLQSDQYEGFVKYLTIKNPLTGMWEYYEQSGPIYGEASAPIRWENTLIPWLMEQGFERGENEKSVLYHAERDLALVVYVDDVLADGERTQVDWIFQLMDERFDCKDAEYLTKETPLDYVGIEVEMTDERIYMHMDKYIQNCIQALNLEGAKTSKAHRRPISRSVFTQEEKLTPGEHHYFLRALGMLGWLANTARPDVAYTHSRIGQHAATPTQEAMSAVTEAFLYLKDTPRLALSIELYDEVKIRQIYTNRPDCTERWKFYCDSDYAGNQETQNKRRSQNANVFMVDGAPVHWCSKVSSVAFAHPDIGEAHADLSSGACEVYAAGNAAQDLLHFSYCVNELGMTESSSFPKPMKLLMDNTTAEIFTNNTAFKTRLKHIDVRQAWVKTLRDKSIVIPVHVPSVDNLADLFTKILGVDDFQRLRDQMMVTLP